MRDHGRAFCLLALVAWCFATSASYGEDAAQKYQKLTVDAFNSAQLAIWYNDRELANSNDCVNAAMNAQQLADKAWGTYDNRYWHAVSLFAICTAHQFMNVVRNASKTDPNDKSVKMADKMSSEAGSIAYNRTKQNEVLLMAMLNQARIARFRGDQKTAEKFFDNALQALQALGEDSPIVKALSAERATW